uniref:Uncharacterized protein n=1 Tax=Timema cristinae TaxID=61476 RepID=A0A7R9HD21_TIMCR|nr:unnamed protein product [Timema cristinae]
MGGMPLRCSFIAIGRSQGTQIAVRYVMLHMTLLVLEGNVLTQAIFINRPMMSPSISGSALTEYDMRFFPVLFESQLPQNAR